MSNTLSDSEIVEALNDSESSCSDNEGNSHLDDLGDLDLDLDNVTEDEDDEDSDNNGPPQAKLANKKVFNWTIDEFIPLKFDFDNSTAGVTDYMQNTGDPSLLDIFLKHLDSDLLNQIVTVTNRYYSQVSQGAGACKIDKKWKDVTTDEMLVFFGLCMLMSQNKKHSLDSYWSQDPLIATPIFSKYMTRERFALILRFLHFSDNENQSGDRDQKIRPIIEYLNDVFSRILNPFQNLWIDESLVLFKGRLSFKQFIPSKRHRFGVKLFILCGSETGYVLKIVVYLGRETRILQIPGADIGKSGEIVMELMEEYLGRGHSLFTDNWYSSPNLFKALHEQQTNACGTVKRNRRGLEKITQKLKPG